METIGTLSIDEMKTLMVKPTLNLDGVLSKAGAARSCKNLSMHAGLRAKD